MKILIIVSSIAQVEMFRILVKKLDNFQIKFINTEMAFKNQINELLQEYGFNFETLQRFNIAEVNKVLEREEVDIILTAHDQTFMDILFIKVSNSRKKPSLTIQDGVLMAIPNQNKSNLILVKYFLKMPLKFIEYSVIKKVNIRYLIESSIFHLKYRNRYSFVYGLGVSTKIAVFGESVKKMLISKGTPSDKIVVVGNPKFDKLKYIKNNSKKPVLKEKWNIPEKKFIISIITQYYVEAEYWTPEQRKYFISEIARSVSNLKDVHLIIKIHPPYEKEENYSKIMKNFSVSTTIFNYEPVEEILSLSDVVLTVSSTAALEAMILGIPVMIINLFNEKEPLFYKNSGAIYVNNRNEIFTNLKELYSKKNIINSEKVKEFLFEQSYKTDGKSSERIANLIKEMINNY